MSLNLLFEGRGVQALEIPDGARWLHSRRPLHVYEVLGSIMLDVNHLHVPTATFIIPFLGLLGISKCMSHN